MEYCNGGSLFNTVRTQRRLKESMARWFFQQLILAVDYTHRRGVANRDIKLENLLLHVEEGLPHPLVKMCDFGYSKADFRSAAKSQVRRRAVCCAAWDEMEMQRRLQPLCCGGGGGGDDSN